MKYCDYCGRTIAGIILEGMGDEDDVWQNSYRFLKDTRISKINSRFKKLIYKIFYIPHMPIYYEYGIDFCNKECYSKWKEIFNIKVKQEIEKTTLKHDNKSKHSKGEKT